MEAAIGKCDIILWCYGIFPSLTPRLKEKFLLTVEGFAKTQGHQGGADDPDGERSQGVCGQLEC